MQKWWCEGAVLCYVLMNYEKGKESNQSVVSLCHRFDIYGYKRRFEIGNSYSNCYGMYCMYIFFRNVRKKIIESILFLYNRNIIIIYSSFLCFKKWSTMECFYIASWIEEMNGILRRRLFRLRWYKIGFKHINDGS
jgi:hypothetical protein